MMVQRDIERAVREWLAQGDDELPAHVKKAVFDEVADLPRDGVRISVRRLSWRISVGVAAAFVTIAVIITSPMVLRGTQPAVGGRSAPPQVSASPTSSPSLVVPSPRASVGGVPIVTVIPRPSETPRAVTGPPASSRPLEVIGPIIPGRYEIPKIAGVTADYAAIDLTLPAGWTLDRRRIVKHAGGANELSLSWWVVDDVYYDPCHWKTSPVSPIDLRGHNHNPSGDLIVTQAAAAGLAGQLGRMPSSPQQSYLGGHLALKIALTVGSDVAIPVCDDGRYVAWSDRGDDHAVNDFAQPGQIDVVYEVDLDRSPLTIDASHGPAASPADLQELQAVLDSIVIT